MDDTIAFFNVSTISPDDPASIQRAFDPDEQPKNMPAGFVVGMADMIPLMGGHAWNLDQNPPSSLEWVDPIWIMGPYNGGIIDYEPMIPMAFFMSEEDREFTELLSYEGQTIDSLPTSYTVSYDATTKIITVTLVGPGTCEAEAEDDSSMAMEDSSSSVATFVSVAFSASILMASSLFF